jgi:hypothetical protein
MATSDMVGERALTCILVSLFSNLHPKSLTALLSEPKKKRIEEEKKKTHKKDILPFSF